jgi:succinate-semialdehyde dehydrogenase / glutarate-semialdehyde dehydrogenase
MAAYEAANPTDPATTLGPLSSQKALDGLAGQVREAEQNGATVVQGGQVLDRPGFYYAPTILTDIAPENPAFTQEFFGPVALFFVVDTEDEAIELANATPFGLSTAVYSGDIDRARTVAARIESGMVFINQPTITAPELPFGGVKQSGFGRELSEYGFGEFVNRKLVLVASDGTNVGDLTLV